MEYSELTLGDALAQLNAMPHVRIEIIPPSNAEKRITYQMTIAAEAFPEGLHPRGALCYIDPDYPDSLCTRRAPSTMWRAIAITLLEGGANLKAYPEMAEEFERIRARKEALNND